MRVVGEPRSVCGQESCDWYSDHAVLVKGKAEATTTRTINAASITTAALIEALRPLLERGEVYLLGTFSARNVHEQPPTVAVEGETVSFQYAAPSALEGWRSSVLRDVRLTVQVRHVEDRQVPELALSEGEGMRVPHELGRWLK